MFISPHLYRSFFLNSTSMSSRGLLTPVHILPYLPHPPLTISFIDYPTPCPYFTLCYHESLTLVCMRFQASVRMSVVFTSFVTLYLACSSIDSFNSTPSCEKTLLLCHVQILHILTILSTQRTTRVKQTLVTTNYL